MAPKCKVSKQVRTPVLLHGLPETYSTIQAAYFAKGTFEISELMELLHSEEVHTKSGAEFLHVMKLSKAGGGKQKENKFHP